MSFFKFLKSCPVRFYKTDSFASDSEILYTLKSNKLYVLNGKTCYKIKCVFCPSKHNLFVNNRTGWFICQNGKHGDWNQFKTFINDKTAQSIYSESQENVINEFETANFLLPDSHELIKAKNNLTGVSLNLLQSFGIKHNSCHLLYPYYQIKRNLVGVKTSDGQLYRQSNELHGMFGWTNVNSQHRELILTTREIDALYIAQALNKSSNYNLNSKNKEDGNSTYDVLEKIAVLTLPNAHFSLPQELLPMLEQFEKITFWFDSDALNVHDGWESAKSFAKKLNNQRCYIVNSKNAIDTKPLNVLERGALVPELLKRTSTPLYPKTITSFQHLRSEIYSQLLNHKTYQGVQWTRFPLLNKLLKGHRRGELTVFTGATGAGKTTFVSEYSLDLCIHGGVHTLWGSFEIPNYRLARLMLHQYAGHGLENDLKEFDRYANDFEKYPMFFMTHQGAVDVKKVVDCMSQAVYLHDISHIVLDNLQFMMGDEVSVTSFDRFSKQDSVVATFRKFATQHNVHITLIIHPRKEMSEELSNLSIFGGIKATQEADNVLILQEKSTMPHLPKKKYIQVTKNRFDGDLGMFPIEFNKEKLSFSKINSLLNKETTLDSSLTQTSQENFLNSNIIEKKQPDFIRDSTPINPMQSNVLYKYSSVHNQNSTNLYNNVNRNVNREITTLDTLDEKLEGSMNVIPTKNYLN